MIAFLLTALALHMWSPPVTVCAPGVACRAGDRGSGMITNNTASPPAATEPSAPPDKAVAEAPPRLGPGPHELVVHWPESAAREDFRKPFNSGAACLKARAAVLDEHRARTAAIAANMANVGVIMAAELEAPFTVCVPED